MNILTTFSVVLLSFSFSASQQQTETTKETIKLKNPEITNGLTVNDKDYTLHFEIEKPNDRNHTLVIDIELHNESHFISPNAKRYFSGKFHLDLESNKVLDFEDNLIEIPLSVEVIDPHPFVRGLVNWVRVNTTYRQPLVVKLQKEFVVSGRLQFTIEPRCTFEEIPFAISYQDGVMKIIDRKC